MGRPAGSRNAYPGDIKLSIMSVYDRLGSADGLLKWAKNNQSDFYRMLTAILPKEQKIEILNPINSLTADDLVRLIQSIARNRGLALPSSITRTIEQEARVISTLQEAE